MARADRLFGALMAAHAATAGPAWREAHAFDAHVFACALAVAAEDAEREHLTLAECLGLGSDQLEAVIARYFAPEALGWLGVPAGGACRDEEEKMVRDLLNAHRRPGDEASAWLASIVARRALRPNHLWQDLGLRTRAELSRLLAAHFPGLAAGNTSNMKWKKYFYRCLCEAEGFSLCAAPSCAECSDFEHCFGDESGESRLARRRREEELALV